MEIEDPRIDPYWLPEGCIAKVLNGPNKEWLDLPSVITPKHTVITRWSLTPEERAKLLAGEDIYLRIVGLPIRPVSLSVGICDWREE